MDNINLENVGEALSRLQREKLDTILLLINSDKSNEEKIRLLRKKSKKSLQKAINLLDETRKTFTLLSLGGERRVFHLNEFESKNKDYIDKLNLIKIYIGEQPTILSISRELRWFETLLLCLVIEKLPLYYPNGDIVPVNIYKKFSVDDLKKILKGEIQDPLNIRNNIEYIRGKYPSIENLITYYNLVNPDRPWSSGRNVGVNERVQRALGIENPIERDTDGVDKDIIIYYILTTNDMDIDVDSSSLQIYRRLGFITPPQTIEKLFEMNHRGETQIFNNNKNFVRRELTQRWNEIPTTIGEQNNPFNLGIAKKIKYFYKSIERELPIQNLTFTSDKDELELVLQATENER